MLNVHMHTQTQVFTHREGTEKSRSKQMHRRQREGPRRDFIPTGENGKSLQHSYLRQGRSAACQNTGLLRKGLRTWRKEGLAASNCRSATDILTAIQEGLYCHHTTSLAHIHQLQPIADGKDPHTSALAVAVSLVHEHLSHVPNGPTHQHGAPSSRKRAASRDQVPRPHPQEVAMQQVSVPSKHNGSADGVPLPQAAFVRLPFSHERGMAPDLYCKHCGGPSGGITEASTELHQGTVKRERERERRGT